jgi:hypothetical protein
MPLRDDFNPRMDLHSVVAEQLKTGQVDEGEVIIYPKGESYRPNVKIRFGNKEENPDGTRN